MTDVFISYSRKDTDFVRRLTNTLSRTGRDVWVDWEDIPRGENWLNEIFAGIERADTFLVVVSRLSLMSEICNDEIRHARERNKRIFPLIREEIKDEVFNEVVGGWYGKSWEQTARENWTEIGHLNWVFFNDDSRFDAEFDTLLASLETDQAHVRAHTRYLVRALEWDRGGRKPSLLVFGDEIMAAETWLKDAEGKTPPPLPLHQQYIQESRRAEDERQKQAAAQAKRIRQFRRATIGLAVTVVLAAISIAGAIIQSGQVRTEREIFGLQVERVMTLAAGGAVVSLDDIAPTSEAFVATVTAVAELAAWEPVIHEFDDVEMVQVPAGCFWMGSIFAEDEQPIHEICFDTPFWIDRYEVTNEQFGQFGGEAGLESFFCDPNEDSAITPEERTACAKLPRETINWFEARAFCEEKRDARLPTEGEWEYAARGPDSLVYPWGNEFVGENVAYGQNSRFSPANVGSRPGGTSWVGAYDMSGNVWEWVSTVYREYPYPVPGSNEERDEWLRDNDTNSVRVLRVGSYFDPDHGDDLRAAFRFWGYPSLGGNVSGFRCARSE